MTIKHLMIAAAIFVPTLADAKSRPVLLPSDTLGSWCFDREATDLKKQGGENGKVYGAATNRYACPADLDISLKVTTTELRFESGAICKVTGTSDRHPDRFSFRCRGNGRTWTANYEVVAIGDGKLFVLDL